MEPVYESEDYGGCATDLTSPYYIIKDQRKHYKINYKTQLVD